MTREFYGKVSWTKYVTANSFWLTGKVQRQIVVPDEKYIFIILGTWIYTFGYTYRLLAWQEDIFESASQEFMIYLKWNTIL